MKELQHEIDILSFLVGVESSQVRSVFSYCLCVMMADAGKMDRVEILAGEKSPLNVFQTVSGETYSVERPSRFVSPRTWSIVSTASKWKAI